MESRNLDVSWETLWKLLLMVVFGWILFLAWDVVTALILAIVLSTAFDPAVTYLEKKGIPRILGTLFMYLIAIMVIGVILYSFIPIALTELAYLLDTSQDFLGPAFNTLNVEDAIDIVGSNLDKINDFLFQGGFSLVDLTSRFLGGLIFVIATFGLSFYLTVGRSGVKKFIVAVLPTAYEPRAIDIYTRVSRKIGKWFMGQLFLSLIIGLTTFIGLWLLGVKYSLFLGILAGVAELIPYVGPIFTGSIAVLLGFSESIALGIYVFILFAVIQQLENHILLPAVMRYTTALDPVVILMALLIGGKIFGVVGLILAVPVAVFLQELLEDWTITKQSREIAL